MKSQTKLAVTKTKKNTNLQSSTLTNSSLSDNSNNPFTVSNQPSATPSLSTYLGIFLLSAGVLLFELALTRILSVISWANLAYMVVGTALFGFGLSGVFLALKTNTKKQMSLSALCILSSLFMICAYVVLVYIPFQMWKFSSNPINYLYLAIWYCALVLPFFLAGLTIARTLGNYPLMASRLYGADLIGAALGSLALIPIIQHVGGEGTVAIAAGCCCFAGYLFSTKNEKIFTICALILTVCLFSVSPKFESLIPLQFHQNKRRYNTATKLNQVFATHWSPISRVDLAYQTKQMLDIWIDGGTNESAVVKWDGDETKLTPKNGHSIGTIYDLKQGLNPNVMIIGASGGREVLSALSYGASRIDAVEMDPGIVKILLQKKWSDYMGNLYKKEKVNFVNDEGRSFLKRQPKNSYDVIQFVNNYTPVAITAGALNLSESFLITKESFRDYWEHLTPNGVLALHRGATLRVSITAIEALRELNIKNPENHILITSGEVPYFEGFFLKKSPWTQEEVDKVFKYSSKLGHIHNSTFLWNPVDTNTQNIYSEVLRADAKSQKWYHKGLGINLSVVSDDKPFIEHFLFFGKQTLKPNAPTEFSDREKQKWMGIIPLGDFPYVAILIESILLGFIFLGLPLIKWAKGSIRTKGFWRFIGYFGSLGFGFIVVEICLMKRYVLFLGNPAYAISAVLVAVLLGAGLGSMASEKLTPGNPFRAIPYVFGALSALLLSETIISPYVFESFLHLSFTGRVIVSVALLLPLGFVMGMPFPLGLKMLSLSYPDETQRKQMVAWAWGINGYTTVIGSASTVFIALFYGFKVALIVGLATYLFGAIVVYKKQ